MENSQDFAPLITDRLRLRPLQAGDAAALHRLVNDWEVAKTLARVPFPYPRDLADEWIASTSTQLAAGTAWHLAVTRQVDGAEVLLGCVGLTLDAKNPKEAELGYWIGRPHWGQGLGPEAAGRLAHWALANLEIDRLVASALVDNERSAAVLRRIGFKESGAGSQEFISRGGLMPVRLFSATRMDITVEAPAPVEAAPASGKPTLLVAAVALIDSESRVLLARRPEGKPLAGLGGLPGGKVAEGRCGVLWRCFLRGRAACCWCCWR